MELQSFLPVLIYLLLIDIYFSHAIHCTLFVNLFEIAGPLRMVQVPTSPLPSQQKIQIRFKLALSTTVPNSFVLRPIDVAHGNSCPSSKYPATSYRPARKSHDWILLSVPGMYCSCCGVHGRWADRSTCARKEDRGKEINFEAIATGSQSTRDY